jgi:L-iditol 2-dehydrogenase
MKAAVYHGLEDLRIEELAVPQIGEDDILLKVAACAVCGTDVRIFRHGHKNVHPPQIVGHEISGVVEKAGKKVRGYAEGDRVVVDPIVACGGCYYCRKGLTNLCLEFKKTTEAFGWVYPGGFAEYMRIPGKAIQRGNLIKIGDRISDQEAAIAEPMACALNGQVMSQVGIGDRVLIIGAGPIGCMHISLARVLGATRVIVSELRPDRLDLARQFEADRYVDPAREDLRQVLLEETDGLGPSVIIIAAPARKAQETSLEIAANHARINFFGGLPMDDHMARLDSNLVHYKELHIHGTSGTTNSHIRTCLELMNGRRIDGNRFVSKVIGLEELPQMMAEAGSGNHLKIVVTPHQGRGEAIP